MSDTDPVPAVADLATSCVRFVREAVGIELDYTSDTLPVLDHYVRARAVQPTEEVVSLLGPTTGAYFGEVVRRSFVGARWYMAGEDYRAFRLEFDNFYLWFNPIGMATEIILCGDAEDWNAHFSVLDETRFELEQSLARSAEVAENDYYTFSVRFDAVQQVTDLLGALEERSRTRRRFGPEVYRSAIGEVRRQHVVVS